MKKRQHKHSTKSSQVSTSYADRAKKRQKDWDRYYATLGCRYHRMNCEE